MIVSRSIEQGAQPGAKLLSRWVTSQPMELRTSNWVLDRPSQPPANHRQWACLL
ncbi:MAG: hypothetical protein H6557_14885 [Lewinellaceae bacterium]|nr:hypothetical protein [Lewinellaceae bacterium]